MKSKHLIQAVFFISAFCLFAPNLAAQQDGTEREQNQKTRVPAKEKIDALRLAFYVGQLSLTPEESVEFLPLQLLAEEDLKSHGDQLREIENQLSAAKTDKDCIELMETMDDLQHQGIDLHSKWAFEFAAVIGYQRASQLPQIERKFRRMILQKEGVKGRKNREQKTSAYKLGPGFSESLQPSKHH
jgi:LAS superfamily LD-carboxypeptidase LdcB